MLTRFFNLARLIKVEKKSLENDKIKRIKGKSSSFLFFSLKEVRQGVITHCIQTNKAKNGKTFNSLLSTSRTVKPSNTSERLSQGIANRKFENPLSLQIC